MKIRRARRVEVLEMTRVKGNGSKADPHRLVTLYYTLEGKFLAERDPWKEQQEAAA